MENQITEIIRHRRSIYPKEFNGAVLDEHIIDNLLENANFAPNHRSNYPWRYIVIRGESLGRWLNEAADIYRVETAPESFRSDKFDQILSYRNAISHSIAIVLHREEGSKSVYKEDLCAVAAGVQNMYLSLAAWEHAAAYWSTGLGTYSPRMHRYLGLGESDELLGFFVLGSVEVKRQEGGRKDFRKFVRYL